MKNQLHTEQVVFSVDTLNLPAFPPREEKIRVIRYKKKTISPPKKDTITQNYTDPTFQPNKKMSSQSIIVSGTAEISRKSLKQITLVKSRMLHLHSEAESPEKRRQISHKQDSTHKKDYSTSSKPEQKNQPNLLQLQLQNEKLLSQNHFLQVQVDQLSNINQDNIMLKEIINEKQNQIILLQQQKLKILINDDPRQKLKSELSSLEVKYECQGNQIISYKNSLEIIQKEYNQLKLQLAHLIQSQPMNVIQNINSQVEAMKASKLELQRILLCKFCNKQLSKSVTVIPCGHSYCFDCKKGYLKMCFICGPEKEVQAVYLNLSMDEIINMHKHLSECLTILTQIQNLV